MAKKTHTWKIGEYCKGGIITVEITGKKIDIIAKDWDHSQGTKHSSDQSNAQEFDRCTIDANNETCEREAMDFLCDLTSSYYADKVWKWIESKVQVRKNLFW